MPSKKPAYNYYASKRSDARRRGIQFNLTFQEWYDWFLAHGVDKNIPQKNNGDAWCMCRYNDEGPYELDNIYLATNRQNTLDKKQKNTWKIPKGFTHKNFRTGKMIQTPDGIFHRDEARTKYNLTYMGIKYRIKTREDWNYADTTNS